MERNRIHDDWVDLGAGLQVGFNVGKGLWEIKSKSGNYLLEDTESFHRAINLLEKSVSEIKEMFMQHKDISEQRINTLLSELVLAGLKSKSDYWAGLALGWLSEIECEKKDILLDELYIVTKEKWANQKNRQVADREIRRNNTTQ